jgi:hypothetical protein
VLCEGLRARFHAYAGNISDMREDEEEGKLKSKFLVGSFQFLVWLAIGCVFDTFAHTFVP